MLDEPLGKLDSLTRITMQAEIVSLWQRKGFTTLLVTRDAEKRCSWPIASSLTSDRPARVEADINVEQPYPRHRGDPYLSDLRKQIARPARIGRHMVTSTAESCRSPARWTMPRGPRCWLKALRRARRRDRDASFPFRNFEDLSEAGLLALTIIGGARRRRGGRRGD